MNHIPHTAQFAEVVTHDIPSTWNPSFKVFRIAIAPQGDEDALPSEYPLHIELVFSHTPSYPDEPPLLKARGLRGFSDVDIEGLQSLLEEMIKENLGMAMIYTLITFAQEWLNEFSARSAEPVYDPEIERKRALEAEEARIAELRRHGTPVTPETFEAWRRKFEQESALDQLKIGEVQVAGPGRMTGRQWFQQGDGLNAAEEEEEEEEGWSDSSEEEEEDFLDEFLASKGEDDD